MLMDPFIPAISVSPLNSIKEEDQYLLLEGPFGKL